MTETAQIVERMLQVLEGDVVPMTRAAVRSGNKIFGAAVLEKSTLDLVVAGTNGESRNPLLHGEVACLNAYWEMAPERRPPPRECHFLSTHEPCSLCLSAITWSGFDNFYYLFSYEDSRDAFDIPHDLRILDEVFDCPDGAYARRNHYWECHDLVELVDGVDDERRPRLRERIASLRRAYDDLSRSYQGGKGGASIPLD